MFLYRRFPGVYEKIRFFPFPLQFFLEVHKDGNAGIKGLGRDSKNKQIKSLSTNEDRTRDLYG